MSKTIRGIMNWLGYKEIGWNYKYFTTEKNKLRYDTMVKGVLSNFLGIDRGIFLSVNLVKRIVLNQTVLDEIKTLYVQYQDMDW